MNEAIRMQVSAFVDGELPENEAELLVRRLSQDALLRKQVAEYLAIGRVMRSEYSVPGTDGLRDRIAAELDERPLQDVADEAATEQRSRYARPLAGLGIAAAVALVAIVGLQQTVNVELGNDAVAVDNVVESVTVPTMADEDLQLLRLHSEASNSLDARMVSLERWAEELGEADDSSDAVDEESAEEEPVNSQP